MKPPKHQRPDVPLRPPPNRAVLAKSGLEVMRLSKKTTGEDRDQAYRRALSMPWGHRIVDDQPRQSSDWWLFVCKREGAA